MLLDNMPMEAQERAGRPRSQGFAQLSRRKETIPEDLPSPVAGDPAVGWVVPVYSYGDIYKINTEINSRFRRLGEFRPSNRINIDSIQVRLSALKLNY